MIEKNKKELRETKAKLADLQEKDRRRAIVLADVLEKTASSRQFQAGSSPTRLVQLEAVHTRYVSCCQNVANVIVPVSV